MLKKTLMKQENEGGFTLVELLVVIVIIGLLAAIAIPIFMNQRQRANDAAVESDIRTVATNIETILVSDPNVSFEDFDYAGGTGTVTLSLDTTGAEEVVHLTDGVSITLQAGDDDDAVANGYVLHGTHTNGGDYQAGENALVYDSSQGGLNGTVEITGGGGGGEG